MIALIVAASGTAVAASTLAKGDKLIAKNSLSGNRLKNRSVTGSKIKMSSLGTVPNAAHAGVADTATTAATAASASISKLTYVTNNVTIPTTCNTSSGICSYLAETAVCPGGMRVTGGGYSLPAKDDSVQSPGVEDSYPSGSTGWTVDMANFSSFSSSPHAETATVYAICAPAATTG